MAIPSSGQLALSTIRDEFGAGTTSNVNLRTLSAAAGLSVPDGFNEFYGLSAFTAPTYTANASGLSGSGTASSPYEFNLTWASASSNYISYNQQYLEDACPSFQYYTAQASRNASNMGVFTAQATQSLTVYWDVLSISTNMCSVAGTYTSGEMRMSLTGRGDDQIVSQVFGSPNAAQNIANQGVRSLVWNATAGGTVRFSTSLTCIFWELFDQDCDGDFADGEVAYNPSCDFLFNIPTIRIKMWFVPN